MTIKEYAEERATISPLIKGREKISNDELNGKVIKITDFDIVDESAGGFAVAALEGGLFLFCGQTLTDFLKAVERDGMKEELQREGLVIKIVKRKSKKSNHDYYGFDIV